MEVFVFFFDSINSDMLYDFFNFVTTAQLHLLYLNTNNLNGFLPNEISTMTNLRLLQVEGNEIIGQVPSSVCNTFSPRGHKMIIQVDCLKVSCSCCASCGWNKTME